MKDGVCGGGRQWGGEERKEAAVAFSAAADERVVSLLLGDPLLTGVTGRLPGFP